MSEQNPQEPEPPNYANEKVRRECEKLRAEAESIRRPFYKTSSFYASLSPVALAILGLIFTQLSGWFDVQRTRISNEKTLLEAQTERLRIDRTTLEAQRLEQQKRLDIEEAELQKLKGEKGNLTNQLARLETERNELRAANDSLKAETNRLGGFYVKASQSFEQLKSVQESREQLATNLEVLQSSNATLRAILEQQATFIGQGSTGVRERGTYTGIVFPTSASFVYAGGIGSLIVRAPQGCNWTAGSTNSWISITAGMNGTGNGAVNYATTPNTDSTMRIGAITIVGLGVTAAIPVYQDASPICTYSVTPNNIYSSSAIGSGSSIVTTGPGCTWTISTASRWLHITSGANGTGSGTVSYSCDANRSSSSRAGTITVSGLNTNRTITINQDGNIAPEPQLGANVTDVVGAAIELDGSASTDQDGTVVDYKWDYGDHASGSGVISKHIYSSPGTYAVTLVVTDDLGAKAIARKTVTITNTARTGP